MQIITPLELSYEQLKAMLRIMPPQEVRQKIWRSWKEEKKALEVQRNDSATKTIKQSSVDFIFVHDNGIKRVASYR
jgi:histidinol-phosphate/aromatic aminotransferase/cobyric acid decarboxylase-like protein